MGNHQSLMRFVEKFKVINGIAHKAAEVNGVSQLPAVQQTLGKLAAQEAAMMAMISGQIDQFESMAPGYVNVNKRFLYAALQWAAHNYYEVAESVKELLGAGPFQLPADRSVFEDPSLRDAFETYWVSPGATATERFKFVKMAWDMLGSDYAGRHTQYERFYGGPAFMNNMYSFWACPWDERRSRIDRILDDMGSPEVPFVQAAE
jgi:4-hydroxyphenylacetate 3-monooxygenase